MMKNVSAGTIARTAVLVIALINQILTMFGMNPLPFSDDQVYAGITAIFTVVAAVTAWWKNNSFSEAAIAADGVMKEIKAEKEGQ